MPKIYYRCNKCHSKIRFHIYLRFDHKISAWCRGCKIIYNANKEKSKFYRCQHTYWYERLFLTLRDIWGNIK